MEKYLNWKLIRKEKLLYLYYDLNPDIDKTNQILNEGRKLYFINGPLMEFTIYEPGHKVCLEKRSQIKDGKITLLSKYNSSKYPVLKNLCKNVYLPSKPLKFNKKLKIYKEGWLIYDSVVEECLLDLDLIIYRIKIYGKLYF